MKNKLNYIYVSKLLLELRKYSYYENILIGNEKWIIYKMIGC